MLNYILYRFGQFVAISLPLKLSYAIAVIVSDLHYFFAYNDRRSVKGNLKTIFPQAADSQIHKMRKEVFRNFAKYLVDFFRFSKLDQAYIDKNIKVENFHYFDEALAKHKGVVIISAHIGNWELGGVVIALSGYDFWAVVLPHKHKRVDRFFNYQRQSKGVHVIPLGRAVRQCLRCLRENRMVALVGDRDFSNGGVVLDFFGKPTLFPEGPAVFALRTGASIVPTFMVRNADDTFTLRIEKSIEANAQGDKEKQMKDLISRYKIIIEDYIKKYPEQWYMFRRFWLE
ncbi:MAG: lysophospholipid acyltransferase family protein [bacterium]